MLNMNEYCMELNELRSQLALRLDELQVVIRKAEGAGDKVAERFLTSESRKPVPIAIPVIGRRQSNTRMSASSQTDWTILPHKQHGFESSEFDCFRAHDADPIPAETLDHQRQRLSNCISEIRGRLASFRESSRGAKQNRLPPRNATSWQTKRYMSLKSSL